MLHHVTTSTDLQSESYATLQDFDLKDLKVGRYSERCALEQRGISRTTCMTGFETVICAVKDVC